LRFDTCQQEDKMATYLALTYLQVKARFLGRDERGASLVEYALL